MIIGNLIGVGMGRTRSVASPPAFHPADLPETIWCADPQTLALDNAAGNVIATWRMGDASRFGARTIYTATQGVNANRPVAQTDSNGILYAASDGVDDFMDVDFSAFGTTPIWVAAGGFVNASPTIDDTLIVVGNTASFSPAGTGQVLTAEVRARMYEARIISSSLAFNAGTRNVTAFSTPGGGTVGDTKIYNRNGVEVQTIFNNPTTLINTSAGGRLFRINSAFAALDGGLYATVGCNAIPSPANQLKILDYIAAQMGIA